MAKVENTTIFIGWWRTYGIDDKPAQRSRAATVHRLAGSEQQIMIGAGSHKLNSLTGIVTPEGTLVRLLQDTTRRQQAIAIEQYSVLV